MGAGLNRTLLYVEIDRQVDPHSTQLDWYLILSLYIIHNMIQIPHPLLVILTHDTLCKVDIYLPTYPSTYPEARLDEEEWHGYIRTLHLYFRFNLIWIVTMIDIVIGIDVQS